MEKADRLGSVSGCRCRGRAFYALNNPPSVGLSCDVERDEDESWGAIGELCTEPMLL